MSFKPELYERNPEEFEFNELIGSGGFGEVYKALENSTGKCVAIKKIKGSKAKNAELFIGKLAFPYIIPYYGFFTSPEGLFIVMKYCEKGSIKDRIERHIESNENIAESKIISWTRELLEVIWYMEKNKIIHNDIKPGNLLLYRNDKKDESIYLIDLGEARLSNSCNTESRRGTILYMAPEKIDKNESNYKTEIWSCGITTYELVHLKLPFETEREIRQSDKRQPDFEMLTSSQKLKPIILSMLSFDPSKRRTAFEYLKYLDDFENPDKRDFYVATGKPSEFSRKNSIQILNLTQRKLVGKIEIEDWKINAMIVLQNGFLASASGDKTIKIWNLENGNLVRSLRGHTYPVNALATNGFLASCSNDETIRVWNVNDGSVVKIFGGGRLLNQFFYANTRETSELANIYDEISNVKYDPLSRLGVVDFNYMKAKKLVYLKNGNLASSSGSELVYIWSLESDPPIRTLNRRSNVTAIVALFDAYLACGSRDKMIKIWDTDKGNLVRSLEEHSDQIKALTVLSNGYLASASDDKTIKIWNIKDGSLHGDLKGEESVTELTALPNGYLVSSERVYGKRLFKLWSTSDGRLVDTFEGSERIVVGLSHEKLASFIYSKNAPAKYCDDSDLVSLFDSEVPTNINKGSQDSSETRRSSTKEKSRIQTEPKKSTMCQIS